MNCITQVEPRKFEQWSETEVCETPGIEYDANLQNIIIKTAGPVHQAASSVIYDWLSQIAKGIQDENDEYVACYETGTCPSCSLFG